MSAKPDDPKREAPEPGPPGHARPRHLRPMTPAEIAAVPDEAIDFGDVPELDEAFWARARLVEPDRTRSVTLRVKASVLEAFKAGGKGYQTRMNAVLESYAKAALKPPASKKAALKRR